MSNLAALPIIIPLISGILLIFLHNRMTVVRILAKVLTLGNLAVVAYIAYYIYQNGTITLEAGGWQAPYGIVLVADMLSIILVLTTNLVAVAAVFYAPSSLSNKQEHFYFYTFYFLLITGVSGAFLTGDIFNLFVFYEVMLMASYALIVLGGGRIQLRESIKYVLINLFSSVLFVTTVAFLYSVVGTVNMAQLAERVGEVEQKGILTTIAILFFFVFAIKAALFPLYYWLPNSYVAPNPVVSALFGALLTKVGIYSILRVFTLIFIYDPNLQQFFIWIAGLTMLFGVIGALSTNNIKLVIAYNIIPAVGFMILGIGLFNQTAISGTVYYLVHDMIIKAALFLLVGAVAYLAGTTDLRKIKGFMHHYPVLGWLFLLATFVLAGIPPFSGFIGKLLLLQAGLASDRVIIVIIGLITSFLILLSLMRIFIQCFWGEKDNDAYTVDKQAARKFTLPVILLLFFSVVLGIGAEFFYPIAESIGKYLMNPEIYIDSVLKE
ncbi:Na+/H+ antiporter subunit D [Aquibacillus sp. 3ASR75-11]|uniref:Na+/H+ antiporter subunit D n=1 Tax=Terrihalobacillus insolitus TaxID=2950438 RepID=A0A9X3WUK9_9BACI|nr:Na+/H+ antiporter subunit D [Terrihalobacillus insolitus]MDC3413310.1 Na+/H+ antiporter subunit D [Terrihalobacillus insolitus]MDC3424893.1 Na+/H+ antiporter subunit D [Terrihalobacillus insolitus]